MGWRAGQR